MSDALVTSATKPLYDNGATYGSKRVVPSTPSSLITAAEFESAITNGWQGAFKVDITGAGNMSSQYIESRIAYNPNGNSGNGSIFINGNTNYSGIAEIAIPVLSATRVYGSLNNAGVLQSYVRFFTVSGSDGVAPNLPYTGEPTDFTASRIRTGGMQVVGSELFVDAYDYYDSAGTDTQTTFIVRDCTDLANSQIDGWFEKAGSARTVKYMSEVPSEWQTVLGGPYLTGQGAGMSISGRFSEGPSLYTFDPADFTTRSGAVATVEHQQYPVSTSPLSEFSFPITPGWYSGSTSNWNAYNRGASGDINDVVSLQTAGNNLMWTQVSDAVCGFIIPNTRTYCVIGNHGCLNGSGGYKITNDMGRVEAGPAAYYHDDYHSYYWLFDLDEIVSAANSWDTEPYAYGIFDSNNWKAVAGSGSASTVVGLANGGTFDLGSKKLFVVRSAVANSDNKPIVDVYDLAALGG